MPPIDPAGNQVSRVSSTRSDSMMARPHSHGPIPHSAPPSRVSIQPVQPRGTGGPPEYHDVLDSLELTESDGAPAPIDSPNASAVTANPLPCHPVARSHHSASPPSYRHEPFSPWPAIADRTDTTSDVLHVTTQPPSLSATTASSTSGRPVTPHHRSAAAPISHARGQAALLRATTDPNRRDDTTAAPVMDLVPLVGVRGANSAEEWTARLFGILRTGCFLNTESAHPRHSSSSYGVDQCQSRDCPLFGIVTGRAQLTGIFCYLCLDPLEAHPRGLECRPKSPAGSRAMRAVVR
jgi:hypothetical protein